MNIVLLEHIQKREIQNAHHVQMELIHPKEHLHVLIVQQEHIQIYIKLDVMIAQLEHIQKKELQNAHHVRMELIHQHLIPLHVLNALLEQSQISIEHHA